MPLVLDKEPMNYNDKIDPNHIFQKILVEGQGQNIIISALERNKGKVLSLSSIASDRQLQKEFGRVDFGVLQKAAESLHKKGKIKYDGVSQLSLDVDVKDRSDCAKDTLNKMKV